VVRDTFSSAANDARVARRRGVGLMTSEATWRYAWAVGRTTISPTSTPGDCSMVKAIADVISRPLRRPRRGLRRLAGWHDGCSVVSGGPLLQS